MTKLTKNQSLVFKELESSDVPLTAYELLDALRDYGLRAPLQIYRALDKLIALDKVHRLESMNSFIACAHDHHDDHDCGYCAFQICEKCGTVEEFHNTMITNQLEQHAKDKGFDVTSSSLEIRGICQNCR